MFDAEDLKDCFALWPVLPRDFAEVLANLSNLQVCHVNQE
jgi:hypothetical protein